MRMSFQNFISNKWVLRHGQMLEKMLRVGKMFPSAKWGNSDWGLSYKSKSEKWMSKVHDDQEKC